MEKNMGQITFDMKIKCVELSYADEYILFAGETFADHTISAVHIYRFDDFIAKMLNIAQGEKFDESHSLYTKEFHEFTFSRIKFGLLNDRIYYGTEGGSVKCMSLNMEDDLMSKNISAHEITSLNFSKRYEFLIATTYEGYTLFDPETLEIVNTNKTQFKMNCAQISP